MIYGVSILAICMFFGKLLGEAVGLLVGINADVGGVGFAMVLLLLVTGSQHYKTQMDTKANEGIGFWKEMYIPVVIAMRIEQRLQRKFEMKGS